MTTCNCMGPQNGQPLCPCQMRALASVDASQMLVSSTRLVGEFAEWRSINTAPREPLDKSGYGPTIFLLVDGEPAVGFWDHDYSNFYMEGRDKMNPQPSHWMAIPPQPIS